MVHFLGVDIGSAASKAVAVNEEGEILASAAVQLGTGTKGVQSAVETLYAESALDPADRAMTVATGYGRMKYTEADFQMSEITCHAKGIRKLLPTVRTVIDIGGQDSKAIRIDENGAIGQFVMNDKCAAGTGRFLEVMSRVLDADVSQLGELDALAKAPVSISNTCTVFAESEVISRLSEGAMIPDIVAGIHQSVAKRVAGLALRLGIEEDVALTGGVALNRGIIRALEEELKVKLKIAPQPQLTGAYGAAILGRDRYFKELSASANNE
ncbi:acyl-CoA dehydratase activase [Papillibacter cinnamivorans]|uniref:CoA-substrate-specific enzyme activase, putative n=1 Tax=Papillibacter cinnamivorans DSM 12816 TaxID=1122930 RepID=A0A1W2BBC1_9FIRM|nr:acyl-CoA dehydratase activase [Papillibacter cinnamivorans]SMC70002.1 CoA-substrate-specific enzyme activase, putative [Papillibacter cinnamivorans DSM 12816]